MQLLNLYNIKLLCVHGQNSMLLVEGRGEMAVLPAVTLALLYHIAMYIWNDCNIVSTG